MPWSDNHILRFDTVSGDTASATVRLAGEIDITSVDAVRRAVTDLGAGTRRITLDLSRVTFCDVAGTRFLVEARSQAADTGTDLIVRHPQPPVYRVLELTGALPLVCPDLVDASVPAQNAAVVGACEAAVLEAIRVSGSDMGNVQLLDPATGALRIIVQRGFKRSFLEFFEIVHDEQSACGAALAAGAPVWVADVTRSPIFAATPALDVMLAADARAVASVPVHAHEGGDLVGMISVHCRQPTAWTEQQRKQLTEVAAVTGRVLSTAT
jgi:anti-anti-sigma factor